MPAHIRVGLRFDRSQAHLLHHLADRVRAGEIQGDIATFEQAELAALTGEPLEVHCTNLDEAWLMIAGYRLRGAGPTAVETLNS